MISSKQNLKAFTSAAMVLVVGSACTRTDPASATAPPSSASAEPSAAAQTPAPTTAQPQQLGPHSRPSHHTAHAQQPHQTQPSQPQLPPPSQPGVAPPTPPSQPGATPQPAQTPPPPQQPSNEVSRPDAVAACKRSEDEWKQACGCPLKIVIDVASYRQINDSFNTQEDFELDGKHFCEEMLETRNEHFQDHSVATLCKTRKADMCKITTIRFTRSPVYGSYDCNVSNGTAVALDNGQARSAVDNCYRRVTTW